MYRYLLLLLLILPSCKESEHIVPIRAMYYWKTNFQLSQYENAFLKEHKVNRLYVKYMDIGIGNGEKETAIPLSITHFQHIGKKDSLLYNIMVHREWIPVIYITNETFTKTDTAGVRSLAEHINSMLQSMWLIQADTTIIPRYREVQFDCDWSQRTRDKYFYFLEYFKKQPGNENVALSATIRLHQYKYPEKTGVPPVNSGMLMFYNMGDIRDIQTVNSIYNSKAALQYQSKKKYPLPLNMVLPAYSWTTVFRNRKIIKLYEQPLTYIANDSSHFKPIKQGQYLVISDTTIQNTFYRFGDVFKFEHVSDFLLLDAAATSQQFVPAPGAVAFFSLNETQLTGYDHQTFEKAFAAFQ